MYNLSQFESEFEQFITKNLITENHILACKKV